MRRQISHLEPRILGRAHELADSVRVRGHEHALTGRLIAELRLPSPRLAVGMQLAEKRDATSTKHARGLAEHRRHVTHVLEHEFADHHVD